MGITTPATFPAAADVTITTTAAALPSLAAGATGILVTAHPSNTVVIRIGDSAVSASKGQPFPAKASFVFTTNNASNLWAVTESGTAVLCVAPV